MNTITCEEPIGFCEMGTSEFGLVVKGFRAGEINSCVVYLKDGAILSCGSKDYGKCRVVLRNEVKICRMP